MRPLLVLAFLIFFIHSSFALPTSNSSSPPSFSRPPSRSSSRSSSSGSSSRFSSESSSRSSSPSQYDDDYTEGDIIGIGDRRWVVTGVAEGRHPTVIALANDNNNSGVGMRPYVVQVPELATWRATFEKANLGEGRPDGFIRRVAREEDWQYPAFFDTYLTALAYDIRSSSLPLEGPEGHGGHGGPGGGVAV